MAQDKKNELQIELTPEVATGLYSNLAVISHSANEFFLDYISVAPNMPKAKVQARNRTQAAQKQRRRRDSQPLPGLIQHKSRTGCHTCVWTRTGFYSL